MTTYLLKTVFCSAIFYGFHFLFLEKEKMHRFNRFYLLATLILSFSIPLITLEKQTEILPIIQDNSLIYKSLNQNLVPWLLSPPNTPASAHKQILLSQEWLVGTPTTGRAQEKINLLPIISWSVYGLITLILLFRFIKNLGIIWHKIRKNTPMHFTSSTLILLEEKLIPHSFLQYIFLNKSDYENGKIENEILQHEYAHVRQKHSFDVILIEIIHCIAWFNPILILYRKAIKLNHEFLADEVVIETFQNPISYQYLLINKASEANSLSLTSQFNYLITKKRLIMMTKNTSPQRAFLIKLLFAPLFVGTVLMLSNSVEAQEKVVPKEIHMTVPNTNKEDLMLDYQRIIQKYLKTHETVIFVSGKDISPSDMKQLKEIYAQMSERQKERIRHVSSGMQPTKKQFNAFKNVEKFGLWIDGKKVKNSVLNNYKAEDFGETGISKLFGKARTSVTYEYQVDLMTKEYYSKYRKDRFDEPFEEMVFVSGNLNKVRIK